MKPTSKSVTIRIKKSSRDRWQTVTVLAHRIEQVQVDDGKAQFWVTHKQVHPDDLTKAMFEPLVGEVVMADNDYGYGTGQNYLVLDRTGDQLTVKLLLSDESNNLIETDKICEIPASDTVIVLPSEK